MSSNSRIARLTRALAFVAVSVSASMAGADAATGTLDETAAGYRGAQVRGVTLGLGIQSGRISTDEPPSGGPSDGALYVEREGAGMLLSVGYTFSPRFHLRLVATAASHETTPIALDAVFGTFLLEAQYRFASAAPVRPYLSAGLGGAVLRLADDDDNSIELNGGAARIGGGLHLNLARRILFDLGVGIDFINPREQTVRVVDAQGVAVELSSPVEGEERAARLAVGLEYAF